MLSTILVPLDGSAFSEQALPYVERIARTTPVHVVLLQVVPDYTFNGTEITPPTRQTSAQVRTYLERLALLFRERGLTAEISVPECDEFAHTILDEVRAREADLVVMSTHGRSGPGRWLFGSVAEAVMKRSPVPVLLVPPDSVAPWPDDQPLRILVPLDGSPLAEAVLSPTCALGGRLGAELVLVQVLGQTGETGLGPASKYLAGVAQGLEGSVSKVSVRTPVGQPGPVIAETASAEHANMIAMATHGRSGLGGVVLGSVATATLRHTRVPLLVVRPHGVTDAPAELGARVLTLY